MQTQVFRIDYTSQSDGATTTCFIPMHCISRWDPIPKADVKAEAPAKKRTGTGKFKK